MKAKQHSAKYHWLKGLHRALEILRHARRDQIQKAKRTLPADIDIRSEYEYCAQVLQALLHRIENEIRGMKANL